MGLRGATAKSGVRRRPIMTTVVLVGASLSSTAPVAAPALAAPSGMRLEVTAAFESLSQGKMPSAATVQGYDPAMARALEVASANDKADYVALLGGVLRVSSVGLAGPGVAEAHFTITDGQGAYKQRVQFVGTAVPVDGTWHVSWVTMCMLVEEEGVVCPAPPPGARATVPLPYSVSARQQLAAQAPDLLRPHDLVALPDGSLLVADTGRDQVLRWSPGGEVLPIKTPLLATLPVVGAPGFPASVYPPTLPAKGSDLPPCPDMSGARPFGPATIEKALAEAGEFNSVPPAVMASSASCSICCQR